MTEPKKWVVMFYVTRRGESLVKKFILAQDELTQSKILQSIVLIRDRGPFLKPPQAKKLQSNLYELRIKTKIQIRIFYTVKNNEFYLLHAFVKKSQSTPTREKKVAVDRLKELI